MFHYNLDNVCTNMRINFFSIFRKLFVTIFWKIVNWFSICLSGSAKKVQKHVYLQKYFKIFTFSSLFDVNSWNDICTLLIINLTINTLKSINNFFLVLKFLTSWIGSSMLFNIGSCFLLDFALLSRFSSLSANNRWIFRSRNAIFFSACFRNIIFTKRIRSATYVVKELYCTFFF